MGEENSDIIDRIDELVDYQMSQESSGYDNNVGEQKCPHCDRDWHGLPITEKIAEMYLWGLYDETYSYHDDDTEVICHGSAFIGPMRRGPGAPFEELSDMWSQYVIHFRLFGNRD